MVNYCHITNYLYSLLQVTKLTEENSKLKIESEFRDEEKKHSSLREDEGEKNRRDRIFNQRYLQ